jgi:hypothetical protein
MLDPYLLQMVLRRQEMMRTEWQEAEEQAGRIAPALRPLGRRVAGRALAWGRPALSVPTATIESRTTS